jgi:DNA-binding LacI/PurR family transcriptional regulator
MPANRPERGLEGGRAVLAAEPRPTALLALTDQIAIGAREAAAELGLDIPGDLSIAGFDDIPGAAGAGLTTVRQPLREKGELAGRMLIADDPAPREVILPVELIVRGSTAPPAS